MRAPHKHCDLIVAWANGAEIQFFDDGEWIDCHENSPKWHEEMRYRIKPKIVKYEGWVNIYDYKLGEIDREAALIHPTEKSANEHGADRRACVRIEWEEEV